MDWDEWFISFKEHMGEMDIPVDSDDNDYKQLFYIGVEPFEAADREYKALISYCS